jgi:hypothetical protein
MNNALFASAAAKAGKCLCSDININIKNKKSGKIEEISIAEFFKRFKND